MFKVHRPAGGYSSAPQLEARGEAPAAPQAGHETLAPRASSGGKPAPRASIDLAAANEASRAPAVQFAPGWGLLHTSSRMALGGLVTTLVSPDRNRAIPNLLGAHLSAFPSDDPRRLEMTRTASFFLDRAEPQSYEAAKATLSRLGAGGKAQDAGTLERAWGTDAERLTALRQTMPHWLADEKMQRLNVLLPRLVRNMDEGDAAALRQEAARFIDERDADRMHRYPTRPPMASASHLGERLD